MSLRCWLAMITINAEFCVQAAIPRLSCCSRCLRDSFSHCRKYISTVQTNMISAARHCKSRRRPIAVCCHLPNLMAWNPSHCCASFVLECYRFYFRQEAQLSQRDRATLCVIEYFAKLLKVTQDHSKWRCCVGRV